MLTAKPRPAQIGWKPSDTTTIKSLAGYEKHATDFKLMEFGKYFTWELSVVML
jgi:hypothetical protein